MKEKSESTEGVIRSRKSMNQRHHNGQRKKDKRPNNDLQNTTQKSKDQETKVYFMKNSNELNAVN